jgi:hypothetical protein
MTDTFSVRKTTLLAAVAAVLSACPEATPSSPSYPPGTTVPLPKTRCPDGASCTCRSLEAAEPQKEEQIPDGHKRFEFRLPRTTSAIWIAVDGKGHYYKAPEKVLPSCFYLDLPVGEHQITIHSEKRDPDVGLQTGLTIYEYGHKEGPKWYRSFDFTCGGKNRCTKKGVQAWVAFQRALPKGVLNRCGSVKIRGVNVTGSQEMKGQLEYKDLTVSFKMNIYKFEPYEDPQSPRCWRRDKPEPT